MTMRLFQVVLSDFSDLPAPTPGRIANYAIRPSAASPPSSQNYGTKEGTPLNPVVLRMIRLHTMRASATRSEFFDAFHQEHGMGHRHMVRIADIGFFQS
jgi:hypothetical protein